jgi:hypothetical protein
VRPQLRFPHTAPWAAGLPQPSTLLPVPSCQHPPLPQSVAVLHAAADCGCAAAWDCCPRRPQRPALAGGCYGAGGGALPRVEPVPHSAPGGSPGPWHAQGAGAAGSAMCMCMRVCAAALFSDGSSCRSRPPAGRGAPHRPAQTGLSQPWVRPCVPPPPVCCRCAGEAGQAARGEQLCRQVLLRQHRHRGQRGGNQVCPQVRQSEG